ncbi:hypothetical protein GDO78_007521 [Eleutherodactylus coqui]|uniref:Uncharacterized protein n=1 Tax=Eleutherodactylus coqui TaxID=57060 RepID=A0A8J6KCE3_ELECQ|nr:hypothetical protein GDO78_007521 [Eleutherodactylus coqui]
MRLNILRISLPLFPSFIQNSMVLPEMSSSSTMMSHKKCFCSLGQNAEDSGGPTAASQMLMHDVHKYLCHVARSATWKIIQAVSFF